MAELLNRIRSVTRLFALLIMIGVLRNSLNDALSLNENYYPLEPDNNGWYCCLDPSCETVFYKDGNKWKRGVAGKKLWTYDWKYLCITHDECVIRGLVYLPNAIKLIREKFDGGNVATD